VTTSNFALHRHPTFLRSYRFLPHRLLNRATAVVTSAERPAFAIQALIAAWSRIENIELEDFEPRSYASLDEFFLRRVRAAARPIGQGFVAPADGKLVSHGVLEARSVLCVKGQELSVERIVNASHYTLDLQPYVGGVYAVIFLTPRGYHHVHMPCDGKVLDVRWILGRYFPQNEDALKHIPGVYERNERAVLRCETADGREFLLVMVGASLIGGIHLEALERSAWAAPHAVEIGRSYAKGERIGHFAFGSTVIALLPPGFGTSVADRAEVKMGESLFDPRVTSTA
jgi:phosphatidylserine decarboxylase